MKTSLCLLLLLLPILALNGVIYQVGSYNQEGMLIQGFTLQRNKAFVLDGDWNDLIGFQILDISNPAVPILEHTINNIHRLYDIELYCNRAYLAAGDLGVQILDISDPAVPVAITSLTLPADCYQLTISGNRLYAVADDHSFSVFDISNPLPVLLGTFTDYAVVDLIVEGNLAYLACRYPAFKIVNVANPPYFPVISDFADYDDAQYICKNGDLVFVSDDLNDHYLLNVANPASPILLHSFPDTWMGPACFYNNNLIITFTPNGVGARELRVYDLSEPSAPVIAATAYFQRDAYDIGINGHYLYLSTLIDGLLIYDISDFANPALISTSHIPASAIKVKLQNSFAIIADNDNRLIQMDISNPQSPRLVSQYALPHPFMDMEVVENKAYVTDSVNGLSIFELSENDPPVGSNFHLLASLPTGSYPRDLCVEGDFIYIANDEYLLIVDISLPGSPEIVSQFFLPDLYNCELLTKYGSYLYVASWGMPISIIDVSNVHSPVLAGQMGFSTVTASLEVKDHYLFQAGYSLPVLIYDLANPLQPYYLGSLPDPSSDQPMLFVEDNYLFVSFLGTNNIKCYDLSNPATPQFLWNYQWNLPTWDLEYRNGLLYTCNREQGFSILNAALLTPIDDPVLIPAFASFCCYPNPFRESAKLSYTVEKSQKVEITIYNLRGQAVRHLLSETKNAGAHTINWDGRDDNEQAVASGIYLTRFTSGNRSELKKLVRIK